MNDLMVTIGTAETIALYIIASVGVLHYVITVTLLFLRRDIQPIKARNPTLLIVMATGLLCMNAVYTLLYLNLPCKAQLYLPIIAAGFIVAPYVIRIWCLILAFQVTKTKVTLFNSTSNHDYAENAISMNENTNLLDNQSKAAIHMRQKILKYSLLILTCIIIIHILVATYITNHDTFYINNCTGPQTGFALKVMLVIMLIYIIIGLFSLIPMRKVADAFKIANELKVVTLTFVITKSLLLIFFFTGREDIGLLIDLPSIQILHFEIVTWALILSYRENSKKTQFEELSRSNDYSNIDRILESPKAKEYFKNFCVTEFSVENILFLEAIDNFKKYETDDYRLVYSEYIFHYFVMENAIYELNVYGQIRQDIINRIRNKECAVDMFDDVVKIVKKQIETDSFVRFKRSKLYKQLQRDNESVNSLSSLNLL